MKKVSKIAILLLLTLIFVGCDYAVVRSYTVTYQICGNSQEIDVRYLDSNGQYRNDSVVTPFVYRFKAYSGDHLHIKAVNKEFIPDEIRMYILKNGKRLKSRSTQSNEIIELEHYL